MKESTHDHNSSALQAYLPASTGQIALLLHAHLPYVRHPDRSGTLEERWYFEAVMETYLPLLDRFRQLERDGIPFRLTISLSLPCSP